MIIDCISDLHGHYPEMEGGDLLIVAGDVSKRDEVVDYYYFRHWLQSLNYRKKIWIAGNHDGCIESRCVEFDDLWMGATYLEDSGIEWEGLKFWGSPFTSEFGGWHFSLKTATEAEEKWAMIPADVDVLITHGPPRYMMDCVNGYESIGGEYVGCIELTKALHRVSPKLHVFGHVHEGYGMQEVKYMSKANYTIFVNASHMNEHYQPVNKPIRILL